MNVSLYETLSFEMVDGALICIIAEIFRNAMYRSYEFAPEEMVKKGESPWKLMEMETRKREHVLVFDDDGPQKEANKDWGKKLGSWP